VELDLLAPVGALDLPMPSLNADLPMPADRPELPVPTHSLPIPVGPSSQAASQRPLAPAIEAPTAMRDVTVMLKGGSPPPRAMRSGSKVLGFSAAALLGVGALLSGLYVFGTFDELEGTKQRLVSTTVSKPETARDAAVPTAERSTQVLTLFENDIAKDYAKAMTLAEQEGDRLGQAEAALLFHLRYGPDPVLVGQALGLLEPFASNPAETVRRVVGLHALASGDLALAEQSFAGESTRARLYRSLLHLERHDWTHAASEARAVLEHSPGEAMAREIVLTAGLELAEPDVLEQVRAATKAFPDHPRVQQLVIKALIATGALAEANTEAAKLQDVSEAGPEHRAHIPLTKAHIASLRGERALALTLADEALTLAPTVLSVKLARIRVLLDQRDHARARTSLDELIAQQPMPTDAVWLAVELAVATGQGEQALTLLSMLPEQAQGDARRAFFEGEVHAMRGDVDKARAAYDRARQQDPTYEHASESEARLLAKYNRMPEALALLDQRISQASAGDPAAKKRAASMSLVRAELLARAGQLQDALTTLEAALQLESTNTDALLLRGKLRSSSDQIEAGRQDLLELQARTGGYPGLAAPLARIYLREQKLSELEQLLGTKLDDANASDEMVLMSAQLRLAQNKPSIAKSLVEAIIARNPGDWEAHFVKARALFAEGDSAAAFVEMQLAKPSTPSAEVELWTGKILEQDGRSNEALSHYAKAKQLDPKLLEAAYRHGRLLAYAGAAKQAVSELSAVVAVTTAFPGAYLALGLAQRDLGRASEAIRSFDRAAALDPKLGAAFYWSGRMHDDRNEHAQTIRETTKALEVANESEPWIPQAYRTLGRAHKELGHKAEARAAFRRYLTVAPNNAAGRSEVQRLLRDL